MKKSPLHVLATIALVLGAASAASAETYSTTALECIEAGTTQVDVMYIDGNGYNNNPTFTRTLTCPIFRRAPDTSSITNIVINVDDETSAADIGCYIKSCTADGQTCDRVPSSGTFHSSGMGRQALPAQSIAGHANGYVYFVCDIPHVGSNTTRNGLLSYSWVD